MHHVSHYNEVLRGKAAASDATLNVMVLSVAQPDRHALFYEITGHNCMVFYMELGLFDL